MSGTPSTATTASGITLNLRPMAKADLSTVMEIESRAHTHPWKLASFESRVTKGRDLCWVVETADVLCGYVVISCAAGDAELLNISIDPRSQGQGVGRSLLNYMIEMVRPRAETLFLEVRESNHKAIELYQQLDFFEVGQRHGYYPSDKGREDALIMARQLGC